MNAIFVMAKAIEITVLTMKMVNTISNGNDNGNDCSGQLPGRTDTHWSSAACPPWLPPCHPCIQAACQEGEGGGGGGG